MDWIVQQYELRRQELPTEARLEQVTYWRQKPEVSPDEDLSWDVETSINSSVWLRYTCIT